MERSSPEETIEFTISMKVENLEALNELTEKLTNIHSPQYRQWKTMEELNEIAHPNLEEKEKLKQHLENHYFEVEDLGDFLKIKGRVDNTEELFNVSLFKFQNIFFDDVSINRCLETPIFPKPFQSLISFVTGIANFPHPTKSKSKINVTSDTSDLYVVPTTLRDQYGVSYYMVANNSKSSQGVVEFSSKIGVNMDYVNDFMYETDGIIQNVALSYTVGNFDPNHWDAETILDVQYIMGMAPGVSTSFYVIDGWMYDFASLITQRLLNNQHVPWILSVSYSYVETNQCAITKNGVPCSALGGTSESYIQNTEILFQKIGLSGISIFGASGDAGSGCSLINGYCYAEYPSDSAFITSVGGTKYLNASIITENPPPFCQGEDIECADTGYEEVCAKPDTFIISGGGFSQYIPRPSYENQQVEAYLSSGALLPPTTSFNSSGRGFPDISALAHQYMIYVGGLRPMQAIDGTSASCPVIAALFALINDQLFNQGKPSLGLLNPSLYQMYEYNPDIVFDVIIGNNTNINFDTYGYGAAPGWDATTGLGSIRFPEMLQAILNL